MAGARSPAAGRRLEPLLCRRSFTALGSECELITVPGPGAEAALDRGVAWVREMHHRLSRFLPGSELSCFNRSGGSWVPVSEELAALLRAALWAARESEGRVNVAVASSMLAIGYDRPLADGPGPIDLAAARPSSPLPEVLEVRGREARLRPGQALDLGGIAKGWMADRLALALGGNAVANLGGDLAVAGSGPGGDGWPVGVGDWVVMMEHGMGAATSSTARRRWPATGRELHHLIDPATGFPVENGVETVSVVAASGLEAEMLAKTALIMGIESGSAMLASRSLAYQVR